MTVVGGGGAPSPPRGPLPIPSAERSAGRCGDEAAQPRRSIQEPPRPPLAGGRLSRSLRGRLGSADGIAANIFYFFNFFACLPFAIFHPLSSEIAAGALSFNPAAAAAPDRAEQTAESSPTRRHFVPIPQRQRPPMCPPLLGCGDVALSAPPRGGQCRGWGSHLGVSGARGDGALPPPQHPTRPRHFPCGRSGGAGLWLPKRPGVVLAQPPPRVPPGAPSPLISPAVASSGRRKKCLCAAKACFKRETLSREQEGMFWPRGRCCSITASPGRGGGAGLLPAKGSTCWGTPARSAPPPASCTPPDPVPAVPRHIGAGCAADGAATSPGCGAGRAPPALRCRQQPAADPRQTAAAGLLRCYGAGRGEPRGQPYYGTAMGWDPRPILGTVGGVMGMSMLSVLPPSSGYPKEPQKPRGCKHNRIFCNK